MAEAPVPGAFLAQDITACTFFMQIFRISGNKSVEKVRQEG
jgi:hypothetical protein